MASKSSSTRNNPINSTDLESGIALGGSGSSSSIKVVACSLPPGMGLDGAQMWMREKKEQLHDPSIIALSPPWEPVLHGAPLQMRKNKEQLYDPGPYHHARPDLRQLEAFKDGVVKLMLEEERRLLFLGKILGWIDDIPHFYGGLSKDEFSDRALEEVEANKLSSAKNNHINSTDLESGIALGGSGSSSSIKVVACSPPPGMGLDGAQMWMREKKEQLHNPSSIIALRPPWEPVLHGAPPQMRKNKEQLYDPGPYHHARPDLRQLEAFKDEVVKLMLEEEERRLLFRGKILGRIDDIPHFYGSLSKDEFSDYALEEAEANKLSSAKNNHINSTDLESGIDLGGSRIRPLWMRVLHRVPQGLRENKEQLYDPCVMSLGPYHHGRPQLRRFEEFKDKVVKVMLKEDKIRHPFRNKILERVDDIRHFYGGLSRAEFDDDVLADMMLRDACTLLFFLKLNSVQEDARNFELGYRLIGIYQTLQAWDDVFKLENQIPWWLMNLLISLTYNDDNKKGKDLILRGLSFQAFGNYEDLKELPWDEYKDEYNPLHFLEAIRNTNPITANMINDDNMKESSSGGMVTPGKRSFLSVRELKAKGIYFKPSSHFPGKTSFSSYYMFGVLHLPTLAFSKDTKVAFSNVMAFEMSPGSPGVDLVVTSHLTFMKSMIQSSEDVKLLQEKGIIVSFLDNNEEIVRMFKEMDTFGVDMLPFYDEIKNRINHHCDSKARTWIAELINTNFRSPWTAIALLSAAFLLCLTFLQTYYTINPK